MRSTAGNTREYLPPPTERSTILGWLHKNLFSTWFNALLTVFFSGLVLVVVKGLLSWLINTADWEVIQANFRLFMVGQYPVDQLWRLWLGLYVLGLLAGLGWGIWVSQRPILGGSILVGILLIAFLFPFDASSRLRLATLVALAYLGYILGRARPKLLRRVTLISLFLYFPLFMLLTRGLSSDNAVLPQVTSNFWGGLLLTFLLTFVGIFVSFPIGVLLALGRRSRLGIIRTFCITYIEFVRGVPLITVLFMAQVMLPLFLPANLTIDRVLRAMAGIVLFSAAYLAENVRGGLQAIPKGQYEAADSLGLNGFQTTVLIILPQALRLVIPILVGQFISLFKDTTLVAIVGLLELLGIGRAVLAQPDFIGLQIEVYTFISLLYWIFSYAMSYASQRLEGMLGVGQR